METAGSSEATHPAVAARTVDLVSSSRIPTWVLVALVTLAAAAIWLVAFDNGQASALADSTGTALHELFHDGRHLLGAPCH